MAVQLGSKLHKNKVLPDLIPLLILVLLGELLSPLEDVGTLGFASILCRDKLTYLFKRVLNYLKLYLGLDSLLGPEGAVLRLPLPPLQDRLRHCRQFTFHSHCGF